MGFTPSEFLRQHFPIKQKSVLPYFSKNKNNRGCEIFLMIYLKKGVGLTLCKCTTNTLFLEESQFWQILGWKDSYQILIFADLRYKFQKQRLKISDL